MDLYQLDAVSRQMQLDARVSELQSKPISGGSVQAALDMLQDELYPESEETNG